MVSQLDRLWFHPDHPRGQLGALVTAHYEPRGVKNLKLRRSWLTFWF